MICVVFWGIGHRDQFAYVNAMIQTPTKLPKQLHLEKSASSRSHGGSLRNTRAGRKRRSLSAKHSHHIVFKINSESLKNRSFRHPKNFAFVQRLLKMYAGKFFVLIEQVSYQHNHIHIRARTSRRSNFHNFFRVFAGQVSQNLKIAGFILWKHRPFTRIIKTWAELKILKNYIQLNEMEVTKKIAYNSRRAKNSSLKDFKNLWRS